MVNDLLVGVPIVVLATAHSVLGETDILRPLFASEWTVDRTPRWAMERILRFAWHLLTIAWIAIASIALGIGPLLAIAAMSLSSAATIFVMLRGHFAWPVMLFVGLAALWGDGLIGTAALQAAGVATACAMMVAGIVHIYWAAGGTWLVEDAVPTRPDGTAAFRPPPVLTAAVATALIAFGALTAAAAFHVGPREVVWLVWAGVAVLALRAVGDAELAGFSKTVRDTAFARLDDRVYTPLVVFLSLGAAGAALA